MARNTQVRPIGSSPDGSGRGLARVLILACSVSGALMPLLVQAQAPRSPTPPPVNAAIHVETVARGLEHPWGLAFLPGGRMLVTERPAHRRTERSVVTAARRRAAGAGRRTGRSARCRARPPLCR